MHEFKLAGPAFVFLAVAVLAASCAPPSSNSAGSANASNASAQPAAANTSTGGAAWITNGATACAHYLTPQFLGTIVTSTTGTTESPVAQGCTFTATDGGTVSIMLTGGGAAAFHARESFLTDAHPVSGVGDGAVISADGLSSYKGNDRTCDVHITGPSGFEKLEGQALAAQLGTVCNALYALP